MKTNYDVVIATRNRPDALVLSVPSILRDQRRLPKNLIIVDSSDSHFSVIETISQIEKDYNFKITFVKSTRANSCYQRNLGLEQVTADVTIFPDDDSIFYPGAIDEILRIYEKDSDLLIAGVCPAEALRPPPTFPVQDAYQQKKSESFKKFIGAIRYKVERRLVPDPFRLIGQRFIHQSADIPWLKEENAIKVEFMTGFRMSFRTSVIKAIKFNQVFDAYCLSEDTDASFSAYKKGILIGARNAQVYHHKFPSRRGEGFHLGLWQVINHTYITVKHAQGDLFINKSLKNFFYYKLLLYALAWTSPFGRERFKGALFAFKKIPFFMQAKTIQELDNMYINTINTAGIKPKILK